MPTSPLISTLLIVLAPAVGSFLALLADRLPRGEDVLSRASACRSCGARLGWADLVPLVSWLGLRGRCRHCRAAIPARLPLTEAAALLLAVLAVMRVEAGGLTLVLGCCYLWCLLALFVTDLSWFRLPDVLTAALLALALALAWASGPDGVTQVLLGAAVGSGSFLTLRIGYRALRGRDGMGLGDVKLMAGIGAGVGAMQVPVVVLVAALAGLGWAVIACLRGKSGLGGATALPFGAFLCLSCALVWLALA